MKIIYQILLLFDPSFFTLNSLRYCLKGAHQIFIIMSASYLVELIVNLIQYQKKAKNTTAEVIIKKEKLENILEGLKKLEAQKYFLRSDCTIISVAKKMKTNNTYVSKVIKLYYEKNFNQYLNDLRINM